MVSWLHEKVDEIYTTWKARSKKGKEKIVKHCIDYIFYSPFRGRREKPPNSFFSLPQKWPAFVREDTAPSTTRDTSNDGALINLGLKPLSGFRARAVLDLFDEGCK